MVLTTIIALSAGYAFRRCFAGQGLTTMVTTPEIYALGTLTTGVSALVIILVFGFVAAWRRARFRQGLARGG